jgi:hypothetical protein
MRLLIYFGLMVDCSNRSSRSNRSKWFSNFFTFPCLWPLTLVPPSAPPVEFVNEATFPEFIDKAKLYEVLRFGFGRSGIRERLDF